MEKDSLKPGEGCVYHLVIENTLSYQIDNIAIKADNLDILKPPGIIHKNNRNNFSIGPKLSLRFLIDWQRNKAPKTIAVTWNDDEGIERSYTHSLTYI